MNRLIELTGWIVLVVQSFFLAWRVTLTTISHLNRDYGTTQVSSALVERHAARLGHVFTCRILNQEFIILFDVVGIVRDSKARYSFQSSFSSLNIAISAFLLL